MRPIAVGVCSICGEGLAGPYSWAGERGEIRCGLCQHATPPFVKAAAYGSYDGGLRELIHLLKYQQVRPASNILGRMLAETISDLQPSFGETKLLVIPVPLHARKLRQRGFNQSELIARVSLKLLPAGNRLELSAGVLERQRETASQIGLSRHQRRENLRGAFRVLQPESVSEREILLVDDVFTTGTTVSECARVLRKAGAHKVWVATVARTLRAEVQGAASPRDEEANHLSMAAHG